ncbi:MAG: HAD family phosphatase, partial [Verrucomicrobia bacterium]|nr:HAD family phosphatase [Verrucomicrobiota bacterium]
RERGLPMAVGSGGFKRVVSKTLATLGLTDWFGAVVTADEVAHGKPAPDTYLEAARRLGVPPAECLVFEDTQLGLDAATAAGMASVFVPGGHAGALARPTDSGTAPAA